MHAQVLQVRFSDHSAYRIRQAADAELQGLSLIHICQISSESSGTHHISGSGGQLDFTDGAYRSRGGKSIIALRSTFHNKKTGKDESRIKPTLLPGTIVTDPRSQVNWVATEYGMVNLMGSSTWRCV